MVCSRSANLRAIRSGAGEPSSLNMMADYDTPPRRGPGGGGGEAGGPSVTLSRVSEELHRVVGFSTRAVAAMVLDAVRSSSSISSLSSRLESVGLPPSQSATLAAVLFPDYRHAVSSASASDGVPVPSIASRPLSSRQEDHKDVVQSARETDIGGWSRGKRQRTDSPPSSLFMGGGRRALAEDARGKGEFEKDEAEEAELDEETRRRREREQDIAERDAFATRLLERESAATRKRGGRAPSDRGAGAKSDHPAVGEERTEKRSSKPTPSVGKDDREGKSSFASSFSEDLSDPIELLLEARKGRNEKLRDNAEYMSRLREEARRTYLKKREGDRLSLAERTLRDKEWIFTGQKLTEEERRDMELEKKTLEIAKTAVAERASRGHVDVYVMPDSYDEDTEKRLNVMTQKYVEERRQLSEQQLIERQKTSAALVRFGAQKGRRERLADEGFSSLAGRDSTEDGEGKSARGGKYDLLNEEGLKIDFELLEVHGKQALDDEDWNLSREEKEEKQRQKAQLAKLSLQVRRRSQSSEWARHASARRTRRERIRGHTARRLFSQVVEVVGVTRGGEVCIAK